MYALKPCLRPTNQTEMIGDAAMLITLKIVEAAEALRSISF
jgi:hypothetical protein